MHLSESDGLHPRLAELAYDARGCRGDMPGVCCPACAIEVGEDDSPETMRAAIETLSESQDAWLCPCGYWNLAVRCDKCGGQKP